MFKRIKPVYESCSAARHPEAQNVTTSVSEYLRKYGQGKLEELPQDSRPTISDERSVEEMLDDNSRVDEMAFDELDAISELERKRDDFLKARDEIVMTEKDREAAKSAIKILDDPNSSDDQRREAYAVIDELLESGKAKRVRARG